MKQYVSKQIFCMAEPMKLKGVPDGVLPFNIDCDEEMDGYLVENHNNELTWTPKSFFEENFTLADSFIDRMKLELDELDDRIWKLEKFIESDAFKSLEETDRNLLNEQLEAMHSYLGALSCRMERAISN